MEVFDKHGKALTMNDILKIHTGSELPGVNRVEIIDENGRSYVNYKSNNSTRLLLQDAGRTLKIVIRQEPKLTP